MTPRPQSPGGQPQGRGGCAWTETGGGAETPVGAPQGREEAAGCAPGAGAKALSPDGPESSERPLLTGRGPAGRQPRGRWSWCSAAVSARAGRLRSQEAVATFSRLEPSLRLRCVPSSASRAGRVAVRTASGLRSGTHTTAAAAWPREPFCAIKGRVPTCGRCGGGSALTPAARAAAKAETPLAAAAKLTGSGDRRVPRGRVPRGRACACSPSRPPGARAHVLAGTSSEPLPVPWRGRAAPHAHGLAPTRLLP